ncbi:MAG: DNA repair protein RecN [Firmicutes bacterium]|nr:DNA repair protein RecN [Bacillota bacterium]
MIRHIRIKNFAIIASTDIELNDGLNIITGETGAGKSIVIEAVSLALGSRADTAFIRSGEDKAVIQMIADYEGEEYVITREISASGRNLCRINDEIVTLGQLNALCSKLADIHGQYDHQSLLDPEKHLHLVDTYQKDKIGPAKAKVAEIYGEFSDAVSKLRTLEKSASEASRQRDFMAFELKEIQDADLKAGEDVELEESIALLENSEKIYENLAGAYEIASDCEYSILSALKSVADMVSDTGEFSSDLAELGERINGLYYELEDACSSIRESRDAAVFSPEELDRCIARYEIIKRLKEKHGMTLDEVIAYGEELEEKLLLIQDVSASREELKNKIAEIKTRLAAASEELSVLRKAAASKLEELITQQLAELNFNNADLKIDFESSYDPHASMSGFTPEGTDIVQFLITTNKGEPLKPLSKIASGGEMSRIMLAFKKITGDYDNIPTMIFDEIDSGISGIAATTVGRKLKEIADNHQIICITHLPQIAACGSHNYRIYKESDDDMTYTSVQKLTKEEKAGEIARLLGGANITETTMASAKELIEASE